MKKYTVFGGRGFIGSALCKKLKKEGCSVWIPERGDMSVFEVDLGTVIYCAGNGDCNNAPFAVLEANCNLLAELLEYARFSKLIYLSSTRVYMNSILTNECCDVSVCCDDNRRLFNLTKLVGEELCLKSKRDVMIIRPSNVYGLAINSPLFLPAITRNAVLTGKVDMYIPETYAKDYVSVDDVVSSIYLLSTHNEGLGTIINIAAGYNVPASDIAEVLIENTGCEVVWHDIEFPRENFTTIDISKISKIINNYSPRNVLDDLGMLISSFKETVEYASRCK